MRFSYIEPLFPYSTYNKVVNQEEIRTSSAKPARLPCQKNFSLSLRRFDEN